MMSSVGTGFIATEADVETVAFDWGAVRFLSEPLVTGATTGSFGVVEIAAGGGHARHNHPGSEEIIYILSGEAEQMIDDQPPVKVGPGSCIFIPDSVYHSTFNTGTEPVRAVIVYTPAGPERLLRDLPGVRVLPPGEQP
jgi:oxalate decarboxylase/phosphoglucose isomerase-like protein (cupin superfamily)